MCQTIMSKEIVTYMNEAMNTEQNQDMEVKILEAAKVVFVRKGYESTKMSDIAAEVGMDVRPFITISEPKKCCSMRYSDK